MGRTWVHGQTVLMTTDTVGGVWQYSLELTQALCARGANVLLAAMGAPASPAQWRQVREIPRAKLFDGGHRLEWMVEPWDDVRRAGDWLLGLEREHRPTVVHLNGYCHAALPWSVRPLVVGHSCVRSWFEAVRGHVPDAELARYTEEVRQGLRAAAKVIAPSHAMLRALEKHYGPFARSEVIPNGRSGQQWRGAEKKPFVLCAGRIWDEAKNITALARVAPSLPWALRIAGEAQHPDGGRNTVRNVQLLGRLTEAALAAQMSEAAIYALPAKYEPFGLSALEAALCGCALVLGDIDSLRELWDGAAAFVDPDDSEQLAATLKRLMGPSLERAVGPPTSPSRR
jgi:glycogen synthase